MSLDSKIKERLSNTHHGTASIAIHDFDGENIETIIPSGVDLRLFNSKNLNIVHSGNGVLSLYKCEIKSLITKPGTYVTLLDCKFTGKLEFHGTRGRIEGSTVEESETAGSTVKLLRTNWVIVDGRSELEFDKVNFRDMYQMFEIKSSNVTLTQCRTLTEFNNCIVAENTKLTISRSKFFSTYKCIKMSKQSQLIVTSSHLKGYMDMCLALSNTTGRITDCQSLTSPDGFITDEPAQTKGLFGAGAVMRLSGGSSFSVKNTNLQGSERLHDYGLEIDFGSKCQFTSTNGQNTIMGGGFAGIRCNGIGTYVSVINYENITSQAEPAIICENGAVVFASSIKTIDSAAREAILVSTGAKVELDSVDEILGKTWGVIANDGAEFTLEGPTNIIEGAGDDGIIATSDCKISVRDITLITGAKSGVKTSDNCSVSLLGAVLVQGTAEDGINMSGGGKLLAKFVAPLFNPETTGAIEGTENGLVLEGGVRAVVMDYQRIEGMSEMGVSAENGTHFTFKNIELVTGNTIGVNLEEDCRFHGKNITTIEGKSDIAISALDNCSMALEDVELIEGATACIFFDEECDYLHLRNIEQIHGILGPGVSFQGSSILLSNIDLIVTDGGGSAANGVYIEHATGKIVDIDRIEGFWAGIVVNTGSDIEVSNIPHCEGKNSPHGTDTILAKGSYKNINFIKDGSAVSATAEYDNCTFSGAFVAGESTIKFSSCRIDGHFEISEVSYDLLDTRGLGSHLSTDSSGVTRNYEQEAEYVATNEKAHHTGLVLSADMTATNSAIIMDGGSIASTADFLSGSSFEIKSGTVTGKLTVESSSVVAQASNFPGGVDIPQSSGEFNACIVGEVTMNGSSLSIKGGDFGSIDASAASEIEIGGATGGAITAADSGVTLRGATVSGVDLTGGGVVAIGGSAGTVSLSGAACDITSCNATVNGLTAKAGIVCEPGSTVRAGNLNREEVYDGDVAEWYNSDYKIRVDGDMDLNIGFDSGNFVTRVSGSATIESGLDLSLESDTTVIRRSPANADLVAVNPANSPQDPPLV